MRCTLDHDYGCGQEQVGWWTALTDRGVSQERPCLKHMNELMAWLIREGPAVGLKTWRAEVLIADGRKQA